VVSAEPPEVVNRPSRNVGREEVISVREHNLRGIEDEDLGSLDYEPVRVPVDGIGEIDAGNES
jgi:hypothetical protein